MFITDCSRSSCSERSSHHDMQCKTENVYIVMLMVMRHSEVLSYPFIVTLLATRCIKSNQLYV